MSILINFLIFIMSVMNPAQNAQNSSIKFYVENGPHRQGHTLCNTNHYCGTIIRT